MSNSRKKRGVPREIVHREPRVETRPAPEIETRVAPPLEPITDKLPVVDDGPWRRAGQPCPRCGSYRDRPTYYGGNKGLSLYGCTACCRRFRVWKGEGKAPK